MSLVDDVKSDTRRMFSGLMSLCTMDREWRTAKAYRYFFGKCEDDSKCRLLTGYPGAHLPQYSGCLKVWNGEKIGV